MEFGNTSLSAVSYLCLIAFGVVVLLLLQNQYWRGENGHASLQTLSQAIKEQERINAEQIYTNNLLRADVQDLKSGLSAIEEHARLDLGLIKSGETFVQLSNAPVTYSRTPVATDAEETVEVIDEPLTAP
ncbi:cell division protein FtsB [Moraxella caviae]|nr:cell division protein FtsB [Moraxella caviae]